MNRTAMPSRNPTSRRLHATPMRELENIWRAKGNIPGAIPLGHGVWSIPGHRIVAFPRSSGESRYPYTRDGFNFWTYGSGYMHANDGLFSIFPRRTEGQEPPIAFFGGTGTPGKWDPFSILGVPSLHGGNTHEQDRLAVFSPACASYFAREGNLSLLLRVYVRDAATMHFTLDVESEEDEAREIMLSSYFNPMLRHQLHDTDEDRWFREVHLRRGNINGEAAFHFRTTEDKDRYTSISQHAVLNRMVTQSDGIDIVTTEETPSRHAYMGGNSRNLSTAIPLRTGTFGNRRNVCSFTEPAVAGDLLHLRGVGPFRLRLDYLFRTTPDEETAARWYGGMNPAECNVDAIIAGIENSRSDKDQPLAISFQECGDSEPSSETLNRFLEHLKDQVEFCALIKGYVQLSENSLIGVRDVFQALEAYAFWNPAATRAKMLEALNYTCVDGRCMRQYSLPKANGATGRMDLRPFIDQGAWVISAISTYVRTTGDLAFLHEPCGYHRILDESSGRVEQTAERDSVLDHLRRILAYTIKQLAPDTGCLRALYGDWNDALDGLGTLPPGVSGEYGNGVSVMASLQLYQNLREMQDMLMASEGDAARTETQRLNDLSNTLAENLTRFAIQQDDVGNRRVVHGWGHDQAYYVGSFSDADGDSRDSLTSNAFWVTSGMLRRDPSLRGDILAAFDRLDSPYGLKTFHPHMPANERRFGRIGKLPPGTAENGATYVHATAFAIMALFEMGEPEYAWQQIKKILPFMPAHRNLTHSPFVMPNSYGHNPGLGIDGQNMNDWQTGSSNVLLKTILRHVIGLEVEHGALKLQPAGYCPFPSWQARVRVLGRPLHIHYRNTARGARSYHLNGRQQHQEHDPQMRIDILKVPLESLDPQHLNEILVED